MSLYSSIEVPLTEDEPSAKRSGFVPLYADSSEHAYQSIDSEEPRESAIPPEAKSNAALQFAPLSRRKQGVPLRKSKALALSPDVQAGASSETAQELDSGDNNAATTAITATNIPRLDVINTFEDFADYQPEFDHGGENRKRQKRAKRKAVLPTVPDWQDEYDPARPVDFETYLNSTCRQDARHQWHTEAERLGLRSPSPKPLRTAETIATTGITHQQGRRAKLNFAPKIAGNVHRAPTSPPREEIIGRPAGIADIPPPSCLTVQSTHQIGLVADSAEEAYQRRIALSSASSTTNLDTVRLQGVSGIVRPSPPTPIPPPPPPPPPASDQNPATRSAQTIYVAPPTYNRDAQTESRSPHREISISANKEHDSEVYSQQAVDRGSAPGQKGFAARYMESQGWKKGQGLGSRGTGRLAPLFVKPQKDGKTGKIIDRHKHASDSSSGAAKMTRVVLLEGMIRIGAFVDEYLQQDVGDSCSEAYGKVERVVLRNETGRVFVKFTQSISALRCVSTVEGRQYDGKQVSARYYSEEAFERGEWQQ